MDETLARATHALAYPADDVRVTLVVALAVVAFGLLVAVILMAFASPGRAGRTSPAGNAQPQSDATSEASVAARSSQAGQDGDH